jgi:hypothetical protein
VARKSVHGWSTAIHQSFPATRYARPMCDCAIVMFDTVQVGVLGFWGAGVVIDICAGSKGRKGRPEAQCGGVKENPRCALTASRWGRQKCKRRVSHRSKEGDDKVSAPRPRDPRPTKLNRTKKQPCASRQKFGWMTLAFVRRTPTFHPAIKATIACLSYARNQPCRTFSCSTLWEWI